MPQDAQRTQSIWQGQASLAAVVLVSSLRVSTMLLPSHEAKRSVALQIN